MDTAFTYVPIFFMVALPAITAMTMIPILAFHSFTRRRWASRRGLAAYLMFGLAGYVVAVGYYATVGTPGGASPYSLALLGAFFGAGYGGTAAWVYFERHCDNPMRAIGHVNSDVA